MIRRCLEYFVCFDYRIPTKQLCISELEDHELQKLVYRRRLEEVTDPYARKSIIEFVKLELVRRGRLGDVGLLDAVRDESPSDDIKIYFNSGTLLVAVKTFFTADCLLEK
ncbi:hypothetical protein [Thermococcus barophilus]|uniref:Uncharacterized protein n=1 Tax=Thermococcus barophilus TaxID=55802 RepID=A0A0S1XE34_THEBA|nr:hypothetical protein [Thermococcus barophilus]ALM76063.1 hypothetical protein TBCH5v1_2162 [Thermococcus barophilus]